MRNRPLRAMVVCLEIGSRTLFKKSWVGIACVGIAGLYGCVAPTVAGDNLLGSAGAPASFAGSPAIPMASSAGAASLTPGSVDNGRGLIDADPVFVPDEAELPKGECGATSFAAKQVTVATEVQVASQVTTIKPVVLYIMFDQSLSMSWSKIWDPAVAAMESFVKDAKSTGIGVALQYFPLSGSASCSTGSGYSTPAVPVGQLPAQAKVIQDSLAAHDPNGVGTPIEGALRGVTEFCKKYQTDHAEQQCVAVLVTDGKPEFAAGCSENSDTLANIAAAAHTSGVTTFAVGLKGADFGLLDKIAKQGGAPDCDANASAYACDVSSGADKLAGALTAIRDSVVTTVVHTETVTHIEETALPCEWEIPSPPDGQSFDRDKVNIRFSAPQVDTTFLRVASSGACRENGWHFDDAGAPKRLVACPQTCDRIKATPEAKIDVLLGCATLLPQ